MVLSSDHDGKRGNMTGVCMSVTVTQFQSATLLCAFESPFFSSFYSYWWRYGRSPLGYGYILEDIVPILI